MHLAAKYGNMKVAKLLLQKDAPVDAQGKVSRRPVNPNPLLLLGKGRFDWREQFWAVYSFKYFDDRFLILTLALFS